MNKKTNLPVKIAVILLAAANLILLFNYRNVKAVWEAKASENVPHQIHAEAEKETAALDEEGQAEETEPVAETPEETLPPEEEMLVRTATVSAGTAINVRSGPGTGYGVVTVLNNEETVTILEDAGDWTHIQTANGADGYVLANFLTEN